MSSKTEDKSTSALKTAQPTTSKILGVYPQRQDGLYMQRIKIFAGRINWLQWRRVAELASVYTSDTALHITTRQDIELHNIADDDIAAVQMGLAERGLSMFGAGGDSIRNITVCPGCQFDPNASDVSGLAHFVRHYIEQEPIVLQLGRKFKISFSGCQLACARPWINDMGFIAQRDGSFTVIGAGSLGAKPATGIELYKDLPSRDILPLCLAAIEFFRDCGNRENRSRARFRHIRENLGDKEFCAQLDKRFHKYKSLKRWPDFIPATSDKNIKLLWRLQLPDGNISSQDAVTLADAGEAEGAILRINLEHGLELYGTNTFQLPQELACLENNPIIVTCPGLSTCSRAVTDSWSIAKRLRDKLSDNKLSEVRINISGCPNNCAHSNVAEIGLVGMLRRQDGKPVQHFGLFTGGDNGKSSKLAEKREVLPASDVPEVIVNLLNTRNSRTKKD